jgi:hypothetical protein
MLAYPLMINTALPPSKLYAPVVAAAAVPCAGGAAGVP